MRKNFTDGFPQKSRTEPDVEFAVREKALSDALDRVKEGKLDRTFESKGDASKVLLRLRKATQGAGVILIFIALFCFVSMSDCCLGRVL